MAIDANGKKVSVDDLPDAGAAPAKPAEEPGWFEPGSRSEALARGFANGATLGLGKYANAAVDAATGNDSFQHSLDSQRAADAYSMDKHPAYNIAGSVIGSAPGALATGGLGGGRAALAGAAQGAVSGGAQTGDATGALTGAAIGGVLPSAVGAVGNVARKAGSAGLDALTSFLGADKQGVADVADQIGHLATPRNAVAGQAKAAGVELSSKDARELSAKVGNNGLSELTQPQWKTLSDFIASKNAQPSALQTVSNAAKSSSTLGSAAALPGALLHSPALAGLGAAVGGAAGAAGSIKDTLSKRAIQQALSPAAKAGEGKVAKALASAPTNQAAAVPKFSIISNLLNQSDADVRAATNPDNPQNTGD